MKTSAIALNTFASTVVLTGGGGGGGGGRFVDERPILERTVGSVVLDRINGYPIGSVANLYRSFGGVNSTVLDVLENAFGNDFEAIASQGRDFVIAKLKEALRAAMTAENLPAPTTQGFRDMLFHLDASPGFNAFQAITGGGGGGGGGGGTGGGGGGGGGGTGGGGGGGTGGGGGGGGTGGGGN